MADAGCPQKDAILALLEGRSSLRRQESLIRHIDACPACQGRIRELDGRSLPHSPRLPTGQPEADLYEQEEECRAVVARVALAVPASSASKGDRPDGKDGAAREPVPDCVEHYVIEAEIGRGGMGIVYKARDRRLNRPVALKMIRSGLSPSLGELERFRTEAETAAVLDHPGIVPIFEVGMAGGTPFFAMALIEGRSLADLVADGPIEPVLAATLMKQVAQAVAFAHERGVIHRDLKPANILLDAAGQPRVGDFGLAKRIDADSELTGTGDILGTPGYMPPEQAEGRASEVGPIADVYAIGATLYCLLTGRPPFQAASKVETIRQAVERDPVPPRQLNRAIPRDLETICLKCLEKASWRRYASAAELAEELGRFLDGRPVHARRVGGLGTLARWAGRKPLVAGLVASLVLVALLGASGVVWKWREADVRAVAERRQRYRADMGTAASSLLVNNASSARSALEDAPPELRGWEWRHLASHLDRSSETVALGRSVMKVEFLLDGRRLLVACTDGSVSVVDPATGRVASAETVTDRLPIFAAVGPPERIGLTTPEGPVTLWDPDRGGIEPIFGGSGSRAVWMHATPDRRRLVAGFRDGRVVVWDVAAGRAAATFDGHGPSAYASALSPDGRRVAVGLEGSRVRVWDLESGRHVDVKADPSQITMLAFSPDGRRIVSAHSYPSFAVCLLDVESARPIRVSAGHENQVHSVAFSPDGSRFASGSMDQTVRLWEGATGEPLAALRGHSSEVYRVAFSPDSRYLVSASRDQSLRLWDAVRAELVAVLGGHRETVWWAAWSPDGRRIASASSDGTVRTWDVPTLVRNGVLRGHSGFVYDLAWTPDGRQILSAAWDGTVRTWDVAEQREVGQQIYPTPIVSALALSRDGRRLAAVRGDKHLEVRRLDGRGPALLLDHATDFWRARPGVAFHPTGSILAAAGERGKVVLWDLRSNLTTTLSAGDPLWLDAVAFSPDGRRIAAAGEEGTIRIWDFPEGREVVELKGHTLLVNGLVFSPDGRRLASASEDRTARLWDWRGGAEVATLAHDGVVFGAAFSPDGSRLATACADNTVRLWDVAHGEALVELRGHGAYVHAVAFSPDGTILASASGDKTIRLWDTLTPKERSRKALATKAGEALAAPPR